MAKKHPKLTLNGSIFGDFWRMLHDERTRGSYFL